MKYTKPELFVLALAPEAIQSANSDGVGGASKGTMALDNRQLHSTVSAYEADE